MKVTCTQKDLNQGLNMVKSAISTNLPITKNVLLSTEGDRLKLTASNLQWAITCRIKAQVHKKGAITVPAERLRALVAVLPKQPLTLVAEETSLALSCGHAQVNLDGIAAEHFPPVPDVTGCTVSIDAQEWRTAIKHVVFAAATDDSRPVLTGVHALFEDSGLTLAAADGFRLAIFRLSLSSPVSDKTEIIIPARALTELNRLISDQKEPVGVTINPQRSQVLFQLQNAQMVSQLIQGTFPNYTQLIPQSYTCRAVVDVAEFLRATRSASIFARDGSGIVRLQVARGAELAPGKVAISARAEEIGNYQEALEAPVEGPGLKIAFASRYLSDVLAALGKGQVALETTSQNSPGVIRPVGSESDVHIIMPMFVQW